MRQNNSSGNAEEKEHNLRQLLQIHQPLLIAFSGGVDSAYLTYLAHQELGDNMLAVLAISPSLAQSEKERARAFLAHYVIPHRIVHTHEILDERYVKNDANRCFYCKTALFQVCTAIANELRWPHIAYGFNFDDASDNRPGQRVAEERNILRPLYDCGLTKQEIRLNSRRLGLVNSERPAQPCLASRLLYGTAVTPEYLHVVEQMEIELNALGFATSRARYDGTTLRIEVPEAELPKLIQPLNRARLLDVAKKLNIKFVTLDMEGFRSGKLNRILVDHQHV